MRKIYSSTLISVDGFFEGRDRDLSWHDLDDEFHRFVMESLSETDLFIFGRRMYEMVESYWSAAADDAMSERDPNTAAIFKHTPKIVYSKTLDRVEEKENWRNVELKRTFDAEEIRRLKSGPGKEIWVGGSQLAVTFLKEGLIDECSFVVIPTLVGAGTSIYKGLDRRLKLELIESRAFKSGNVLLRYRPV